MSYSRNFGIRSFENIVRSGRARTPAGSTLVIGEPVILDSAAPGFLKQATAGVAANGAAGVVVYEHIQMQGIDAALNTTSDLNTIPGGRYAQRVHGAGAKVWFKNTAAKTLYDGRTLAAGALLASSVDVSTLAIGAQLTPDGSGKYKVANGTTDGNWLTVEQVNSSTGLVEARFNF
jgi:hypothetical protein